MGLRSGPQHERTYTAEGAYQAGKDAASAGAPLSKNIAAVWIGCSAGLIHSHTRKDLWQKYQEGYREILPNAERAKSGSPKGAKKPRGIQAREENEIPTPLLIDCPGPCTQQWPEGDLIADEGLAKPLCPGCYADYRQRVRLDEAWKLELIGRKVA